jgi:hypothetical protein
MVQAPAFCMKTVLPLVVQTAGVRLLKVTGSPELALALTRKPPPGAKVGVGAGPKVMVWLPLAIVIVTVAVASPLMDPVPLMVKVVVARATVGQPLMAPVLWLKIKPAGTLGLIEYVTVPPKPLGVRVAEGVKGAPTVPVRVWVAGLKLAAGGTVGTTVRVIAAV